MKEYITRVQNVLDALIPKQLTLQRYEFLPPKDDYNLKRAFITLSDLMVKPAPRISSPPIESFDDWISLEEGQKVDHSEIADLLRGLSSRYTHGHEQTYTNDLKKSLDSLREDRLVGLRLPAESMR